MKRFFILLTTVFFLLSGFTFAEEAVLIDFSKLKADYPEDNPTENVQTIVDYSDKAGTSYSKEEKSQMKASIALNNWEVILCSSSRTVINQTLSMTREVPVLDGAKKYAGETVLGIRIHFPQANFNSWALIAPPFEIPAYMKKTTLESDGTLKIDETDRYGEKFVDGYGVVKNVGVIKSVSVNMYGSNFPNGFEVILKDQNNTEIPIFMDYMDFEGWRTLTWKNPNYIADVRHREIVKRPLYPKAAPMIKIAGMRISKDYQQDGGDIIAYIKDISIVYDKAILSIERDIDEEAIWGILKEREESRRTAEFERLGHKQVLRYLEKRKMHSDDDVNQAPDAGQQQ